MNAPSGLALWWHAARPRTLPLAATPVLVGTALAVRENASQAGPAIAALVGALLLQVASNFANDLFDAESGADSDDRIGPPRAVQMGWIAPQQMRHATALVIVAALLTGVYLVSVGGALILAIGIFAIIVALAYTAGPFPLGYHGLGDIAVFVCFGPIAVGGTYYVQTLHWPTLALVAAIPVGAFATAVLVVNNVRDIVSDTRAGKRTLAVRFGRDAGIAEYASLMVLAHAIPVTMWMLGDAPVSVLLSLATAVPAYYRVRAIQATQDGPGMSAQLAATAQLGLVHATLFSLGLALSA